MLLTKYMKGMEKTNPWLLLPVGVLRPTGALLTWRKTGWCACLCINCASPNNSCGCLDVLKINSLIKQGINCKAADACGGFMGYVVRICPRCDSSQKPELLDNVKRPRIVVKVVPQLESSPHFRPNPTYPPLSNPHSNVLTLIIDASQLL